MATFFPRLIVSFLTTFRKKSIPPQTPSASSPLQPTPVDFQAPIAITTASKSSLIVSNGISLPTLVLGIISTPMCSMIAISISRTSLGSLYSGIPYLSIPPSLGMLSNIVTSCPLCLKKYAAERPIGPPPITATLFPVSSAISGIKSSSPARLYSPANLLIIAMLIGSSTSPRLHASSHG